MKVDFFYNEVYNYWKFFLFLYCLFFEWDDFMFVIKDYFMLEMDWFFVILGEVGVGKILVIVKIICDVNIVIYNKDLIMCMVIVFWFVGEI